MSDHLRGVEFGEAKGLRPGAVMGRAMDGVLLRGVQEMRFHGILSELCALEQESMGKVTGGVPWVTH